MMTIKNHIFYLILILFQTHVFAQAHDFGTWTGIALKKKINPDFSAVLSSQYRLNENSLQFDQYYTDLGVGYSLTKEIKISCSYRNIIRYNEPLFYKFSHRVYTDLDYKIAIHDFGVKIRTRVEREFIQNITKKMEEIATTLNRNKLTVSYNRKKIKPYLSYEIFIPISVFKSNVLEKERFTVGISYKINKHIDANIYYLLQHKLIPEFNNMHILGLDLSIDI